MTKIILPNNWTPRPYQREAWDALTRRHDPIKRALLVWHRRAGKDDVCLHLAACKAMQRTGNYWHMLPEYGQARKSVWDAVNPHSGMRRINDALPDVIRDSTRNNDMFIRLKGGSTWQLVGSDSYNSLVGSPPIGVTASEWALADPSAWAYMRPILQENGGWAAFITTPRGNNHVKRMYDGAINDPSWFVQKLTWRDTGVLTQAQADQELREYQREYGEEDGAALFAQEWECSFDVALAGAYYGRIISDMQAKGQIAGVPYDPATPVHTAWDLGISDSTVIYYWQIVGREIHIIDRTEGSGHPLTWYISEVKSKPYIYGEHFLPHDARARELQTGKSRVEALEAHGIYPEVLPASSVADGIHAVRQMLPRCWIDQAKCHKGVDALQQYRREWDDKGKQYKDKPLHDWTSHDADAIRMLAMAVDMIAPATTNNTTNHHGVSAGWMM